MRSCTITCARGGHHRYPRSGGGIRSPRTIHHAHRGSRLRDETRRFSRPDLRRGRTRICARIGAITAADRGRDGAAVRFRHRSLISPSAPIRLLLMASSIPPKESPWGGFVLIQRDIHLVAAVLIADPPFPCQPVEGLISDQVSFGNVLARLSSSALSAAASPCPSASATRPASVSRSASLRSRSLTRKKEDLARRDEQVERHQDGEQDDQQHPR